MAQQIIAYVILALAVAFLVKKFFFKKKNKKGCGTDCGCS
ncbi:MAG: FeoB-associated Cys-rich membrane protein [Flavobacterium sp.]|nr:MAG: FeoB-associated Cys-rich membrane protein [Flavobacterium sp.]